MKRFTAQQVLDDVRGLLSDKAAARLSSFDLELCDDGGRPMILRGVAHGFAVYETCEGEPVILAGVALARGKASGRPGVAVPDVAKLGPEWAAIKREFPAIAADPRVRALMIRRARELGEDFRQRYPRPNEKSGEHVDRYCERAGAHGGGWPGLLFDASAIYSRTLELADLREHWVGASRRAPEDDVKLGDAKPQAFAPLPRVKAADPLKAAAARSGRKQTATPAGV